MQSTWSTGAELCPAYQPGDFFLFPEQSERTVSLAWSLIACNQGRFQNTYRRGEFSTATIPSALRYRIVQTDAGPALPQRRKAPEASALVPSRSIP